MTLSELIAKRANAWDTAKKFLDERTDKDTGMMSAEDAQTYDRMEKDITDLTASIERRQRAEAFDKALDNPVNSPMTSIPGRDPEKKEDRSGQQYKNAFGRYLRNAQVGYDVNNVLSVGTDSDGGYTVPDEFEHTLVEALADENVFRTMATSIKTASGDRKIPIVATTGTASWVDENAAIPESGGTFDQKTLSAYKLATILKVSEELLADSAFNLEDYIAREFARRFAVAEEAAFCTGNGTGKPTGVFDATKGASAGITATKTDTFTADELMDLFYSLRAPYRSKSMWFMNDSTIKIVRKLKDNNGQYIWQPALTAGTPDMILARPYKTSVAAPEATTGNTAVLFGDFKYYWIADRKSRTIRRLNELYAVNGQVAFLGTERLDGCLILPEAIKSLKMA
nr:MAG TPA: major capsid protein [Caudoviricetes sp.]